MRLYKMLGAVAAVLAMALLLVPVSAPAADDTAKIAKLIEQLGSGNFDEREKATATLEKIGAPALEALRKATKSEDAEIQKRAGELVSKMEKAIESTKVLTPTKLKLDYKDTPLPEVIADLNKKTGYNVLLNDPEGKLKDRKVTLQSKEEVTFWEALDQVCAKAGVVETNNLTVGVPVGPGGRPVRPGVIIRPGVIRPGAVAPVPPPAEDKPADKPAEEKPAEKKPVERKPAVQKNGGLLADEDRPVQAKPAVAPIPPPVDLPPVPGNAGGAAGAPAPGFGIPGAIVLQDGKAQTQPTDYRSAVRVRALDKPFDVFGKPGEGEILLGLQITPEPKIQWQGLVGLHIEKAVDNMGQELKPMGGAAGGAPGVAPGGIGIALPGGAAAPAIAIAPRPPIGRGGVNGAQAPIRLKKGEKAAKEIKELTGVITAQVLPAGQPLIVVDNVAKAAGGDPIKGKDGGWIKILEVTKGDKDQWKIRYELEAPPGVTPAGGAGPATGGGGIGGIRIVPLPAIRPFPVKPAPVPESAPAKPADAPANGFAFVADKDAPAVEAPALPAVPGVAQIQIGVGNAVVVGPAGFAAPYPGTMGNGISVADDKSSLLPVIGQQQTVKRGAAGGIVREITITVQGKKGQDPAKVIFSGSKPTTIDIPFTLKNVPLP